MRDICVLYAVTVACVCVGESMSMMQEKWRKNLVYLSELNGRVVVVSLFVR